MSSTDRGLTAGSAGKEVEKLSDKLFEDIIKALEREGGEATLDRLLYAYSSIKKAGRDKVLETAGNSNKIIVTNETLYRYTPELHRYVRLKLKDTANLDNLTKENENIDRGQVQDCRRRSRNE